MKAWFKEHWKVVLTILIILGFFGFFGSLKIINDIKTAEMAKADSEKLKYIERQITGITQACPVCESCKSYAMLCKPTTEECTGYCTKLIEWSKKCNHPVITEKACWNSYYIHRPYGGARPLDCWEASLWFSNGNCNEIPPRPGAQK